MPSSQPPDGGRLPGRPAAVIDRRAVATVVGEQVASGGLDAVSMQGVAHALGVSRATLYRTIPTKDHLVGVLFDELTDRLGTAARSIAASADPAGTRLQGLIRLHVQFAVEARPYFFVLVDDQRLPAEARQRWGSWHRAYEQLWVDVIRAAMDEAALPERDPVLTSNLLLGMCIWVSRWYRDTDDLSPATVAEAVIGLVFTPRPPLHPKDSP
jgi:AcrR family transcriptional regulator